MTLYSRILEKIIMPTHEAIRGRNYLEYRRFLQQSQWWSRDQLLEFQWKELQRLLEHAFQSVPYYQEKYRKAGIALSDIRTREDFARLPVLTRVEVNEHRKRLVSTKFRGKLLPHATGGSTGMPTRFYRTFESYAWRLAAKDRVYGWSGSRMGERAVYLWGAPVGKVPLFQAAKTAAYEMLHRQLVISTFSQNDDLWADVVRRLWKFRPRVIVGYVSSLEEFARYVRHHNVRLPHLEAIIAAAEPLYDAVRDQISHALDAPVFNTYGCREFMSLAGECELRQGLHVNVENIMLETQLPASEGPSEVYITDLHNYGMPFVRYALGDLAVLDDEPCHCGRGLPKIQKIQGRILDVLRAPDGRMVPGEFFPHLLKEIPEIVQYRVQQDRLDHLMIEAVLSEPLSDRSQALLNSEMENAFQRSLTWELCPVNDIPRLASEKRRTIIGLYPHRLADSATAVEEVTDDPQPGAADGGRSVTVAHILDSLEPGGAELFVSTLCREQSRNGHKVSIHCLFGGGRLVSELDPDKVGVHVHGPASIWKTSQKLYGWLKANRPDVVHCHNAAATILAAPIAKLAGVRSVLCTRHSIPGPPYLWRQELKFVVVAGLFCSRVITVSDAVRRSVLAMPGTNSTRTLTIWNGAAPAAAAPQLGPVPKKQGFTLINIARLVRVKDHGTLLRAFALAKQEVSDLQLWLLGGGQNAESLQRLAEDLGIASSVLFLGDRNDVGAWLAQADVFVLSSLSEGLPISLLEAMAAGLPAIVTDVGGMPDVIKLSGAGSIVKPGDPHLLAQRIVQYAQRPNHLPTLGHMARDCYTRYFTPRRVWQEYNRVYEECLDGGS